MKTLRLTVLVLAVNLLLGGTASLAVADDYELIKVPADEPKGFSWPYYLVISSTESQQTTLLVEPNNTGSGHDDPQVHDQAARRTAESWASFAAELGVPLLVPTFPRPYTKWQIYTQALDRDTLLTHVKGLERIDLQLIAMIDDARERLSARGIPTEKKVFMKGFSASGHFVNRFVLLHPERVKAAAIGAAAGWTACTSHRDQKYLRYPVGIADLPRLIGKDFNVETFKTVPLYFYMGELDTNDPVQSPDGYDPEDTQLVNQLFGNTPIERWPKLQEVYSSIGSQSRFVLYQGVGHQITFEMREDVLNFFKQHALPPESSSPRDH